VQYMKGVVVSLCSNLKFSIPVGLISLFFQRMRIHRVTHGSYRDASIGLRPVMNSGLSSRRFVKSRSSNILGRIGALGAASTQVMPPRVGLTNVRETPSSSSRARASFHDFSHSVTSTHEF
jgi:hypothetical protein